MLVTKAAEPVDNVPGSTLTPTAGLFAQKRKEPRILGIDPGTRLTGVVVLEGNNLLYYAVKQLRHMRPAIRLTQATRKVISDLVERFQPDVLAYETSYYVQQTGSLLLQNQEREIRWCAKAAGINGVAYSPLYVRQQLCSDPGVTKYMVANFLVQRFPELAGYRRNQTPRSERYWLNMFDALAVAVVAEREFSGNAEPASRAA
jgi:Holliday junction resolvasome RuvABC endonuclease subunit